MRLIDADAFEIEVQHEWENNEISNGEWMGIRQWLKDAPTIEAEPIRHGKWIYTGFMEVKCNNCGNVFHELEDTNYCPACGCHMDDVVWGEE